MSYNMHRRSFDGIKVNEDMRVFRLIPSLLCDSARILSRKGQRPVHRTKCSFCDAMTGSSLVNEGCYTKSVTKYRGHIFLTDRLHRR